MKNFVKNVLTFGVLLMPTFAFATPLEDLVIRTKSLVNLIIPLLVSVAIAYFIFSVIKYVGAKDEETRADGRKMMINAIIALFVVLTLWGLVRFIQQSLGVSSGQINSSELPNVN